MHYFGSAKCQPYLILSFIGIQILTLILMGEFIIVRMLIFIEKTKENKLAMDFEKVIGLYFILILTIWSLSIVALML